MRRHLLLKRENNARNWVPVSFSIFAIRRRMIWISCRFVGFQNGPLEAILQRERQLQKTRNHCRGDDEMLSIGRDRHIDKGKAANLHGEVR